MKIIGFGTAILACAIPAFGQVDTTSQPSPGQQTAPTMSPTAPGTTMSPTVPLTPGNCQPGTFVPGASNSIVEPNVSRSPFSTGGSASSAQSFETPLSAPAQPSIFSPPSPGVSGIGSTGATSGVGDIGNTGVGSIGTSGIGSSGSSGIGSSSSSPFSVPNAYTPPASIAQPRLPTTCP